MTKETRVIMGSPYGFVRKGLKKPSHVEVITLTQCPVLCHNACGVFYIPKLQDLVETKVKPEDVTCPDCHEQPKPWRIGEEEEIEVTVHMQFGNVTDTQFLRSLGKPIVQRQMGYGLITEGIVKSSRA